MTGDFIEKRRANVIEGGRDPANVILRQRRLKVRRTGKRSREPEKLKLSPAYSSEKLSYHRPPRRSVKRIREPGEENLLLTQASEVKPNKRDAGNVEEMGEMRWESLKMYLPSSSFRQIPEKSDSRKGEKPGRERATTDDKNKSLVSGKNLVLTEKREEERNPRTKETRTIVQEPLKRISSEIVLPPLLLLPLLTEIGDRTIKRRRLEALAPFRRNTKAILKVRLNEKIKRKGEVKKATNIAVRENVTKQTNPQFTPVTVDLPNMTLRKKGIRRVKKRKKKSKEPQSSSSNLAKERNLLFSSEKKKINRVPQVASNCREGKKLRKEEKVEGSDESLKKVATLETEEGQRLLQSVRRALLAAYAMAFATTGTTQTHYRGATMLQ